MTSPDGYAQPAGVHQLAQQGLALRGCRVGHHGAVLGLAGVGQPPGGQRLPQPEQALEVLDAARLHGGHRHLVGRGGAAGFQEDEPQGAGRGHRWRGAGRQQRQGDQAEGAASGGLPKTTTRWLR